LRVRGDLQVEPLPAVLVAQLRKTDVNHHLAFGAGVTHGLGRGIEIGGQLLAEPACPFLFLIRGTGRNPSRLLGGPSKLLKEAHRRTLAQRGFLPIEADGAASTGYSLLMLRPAI